MSETVEITGFDAATLGFDAARILDPVDTFELPASAAAILAISPAADIAAPAPGDYADKLAAALQDVLPAYWDANHPSAPIFAKAKEALDAFKVSL